jgi:hypothetical protein
MGRFRQHVRPLVALLVLALTFSGSITVWGQEEAQLRAKALADVDAIKQTALLRLAHEGTHISALQQQQFMQALRQMIDAQLALLKQRYDAASTSLEAQIGYGTPFYAWWKSWWNSQEEAQRVFQDKIDAAIAQAGIPAQREQMNATLEAALLDQATALYAQSRTTFNQILYEAIQETGLLGPLTHDLVQELIDRVDLASYQLAVQEGRIDPHAAIASPTVTGAVLATILTARIAQTLAVQFGVRFLAGGVVAPVLEIVTGPIGLIVLGLSTIKDIYNAKTNAIEACKQHLWQSYHALERLYTSPEFLTSVTDAGDENEKCTRIVRKNKSSVVKELGGPLWSVPAAVPGPGS